MSSAGTTGVKACTPLRIRRLRLHWVLRSQFKCVAVISDIVGGLLQFWGGQLESKRPERERIRAHALEDKPRLGERALYCFAVAVVSAVVGAAEP
jgi:hypothetical protein